MVKNDKRFEALAKERGIWVPTGGQANGVHYEMMVRIDPSDSRFDDILQKVLSGLIEGGVKT